MKRCLTLLIPTVLLLAARATTEDDPEPESHENNGDSRLGTPLPVAPPHEDGRCRCVCPTLGVLIANTTGHSRPDRKIYVQSVSPSECKCERVVVPRIMEEAAIAVQIKR